MEKFIKIIKKTFMAIGYTGFFILLAMGINNEYFDTYTVDTTSIDNRYRVNMPVLYVLRDKKKAFEAIDAYCADKGLSPSDIVKAKRKSLKSADNYYLFSCE